MPNMRRTSSNHPSRRTLRERTPRLARSFLAERHSADNVLAGFLQNASRSTASRRVKDELLRQAADVEERVRGPKRLEDADLSRIIRDAQAHDHTRTT